MSYWLLKTEPECYSWPKLLADKRAVWDGVSNALALKHLRTIKKGDLAFIYHTGAERAIIGVAQATSGAYPDPGQEDEKLAVVDLKPVRALERPVSLDEMKADPVFAGWELLRISRLGVMPVPQKIWNHIEKLARLKAD